MHKKNKDLYDLKHKFTPQTAEPNADIKSKVDAREKDLPTRMQGQKDIIESRKQKNEGNVLGEYDSRLTFTPQVEYSKFAVNDRTDAFQDHLYVNDAAAKVTKQESDWLRIYTAECQHTPKINKKSQAIKSRGSTVFKELFERPHQQSSKVHTNVHLVFDPKKVNR